MGEYNHGDGNILMYMIMQTQETLNTQLQNMYQCLQHTEHNLEKLKQAGGCIQHRRNVQPSTVEADMQRIGHNTSTDHDNKGARTH